MQRRALLAWPLAWPLLASQPPVQAATPAWRVLAAAAPGSGVDLLLRALVDHAAQSLGFKAWVDNRPGGNGFIAARALAAARPDGRTCALLGQGLLTLQAMGTAAPRLQDFVPLGHVANVPTVLAVAAQAPWQRLAELLQAARQASPTTAPALTMGLAYGTGGVASAGHLAVELLAQATQPHPLHLLHVPHKSLADALLAVARGDLAFAAGPLPGAMPLLKSGLLRPLAVSTRQRVDAWPDVPTVAESAATGEAGLAGYAFDSWSGLFAPRGTPPATAEPLAQALRQARAEPALAQLARSSGLQLGAAGAAPDFHALVQTSHLQALQLVQGLRLQTQTGRAGPTARPGT